MRIDAHATRVKPARAYTHACSVYAVFEHAGYRQGPYTRGLQTGAVYTRIVAYIRTRTHPRVGVLCLCVYAVYPVCPVRIAVPNESTSTSRVRERAVGKHAYIRTRGAYTRVFTRVYAHTRVFLAGPSAAARI